MPRTAALLVLLLAAMLDSRGAAAQPDSVTLPAGARYAAAGPWRLLFGSRYRAIWATPARYAVLDLDAFAGGLTPLQARRGRQTRSLRLRGADGLRYDFRLVDKDLTPASPGIGGGSLRARLRQDQTRAQHPSAVVVADALLEAAGVPHAPARLAVMPDDPRLGPYRDAFGGMPGSIEPHLEARALPALGLTGAVALIETDELVRQLDRSAGDRVDARAYLRSRLMDVLMGDWDRHAGQWRWAGFEEGGRRRWVPIPKDRDYAFVDYDGAVPALARLFATPGVVRFGPGYPRLRALVHAARPLDERFLAGLSRAAWDSVALELRARLTDRVIADAVRRMPPQHFALSGPRLEAALRARRDALPAVAGAFYRRLAEEPLVLGGGGADRIEVVGRSDGALVLEVRTAGRLRLRRTFHPGETRRVRVRPGAGRDTVRLRGPRSCIWLLVEADPREVAGRGSIRVLPVRAAEGRPAVPAPRR